MWLIVMESPLFYRYPRESVHSFLKPTGSEPASGPRRAHAILSATRRHDTEPADTQRRSDHFTNDPHTAHEKSPSYSNKRLELGSAAPHEFPIHWC
jgi:hypothetical protein